jgi:hypothetical protein
VALLEEATPVTWGHLGCELGHGAELCPHLGSTYISANGWGGGAHGKWGPSPLPLPDGVLRGRCWTSRLGSHPLLGQREDGAPWW